MPQAGSGLPAAQAWASFTPGSGGPVGGHGPTGNCAAEGAQGGGALTVPPRVRAVFSPGAQHIGVVNSSLPPGPAQTQPGHHLVAGVGPARRIAQRRRACWTSWGRPKHTRVAGPARHCPPGGDRRRRYGCGRGGGCPVAIYWVLLFWGATGVFQNRNPRCAGATFTMPQDANPDGPPSVDSGLDTFLICRAASEVSRDLSTTESRILFKALGRSIICSQRCPYELSKTLHVVDSPIVSPEYSSRPWLTAPL